MNTQSRRPRARRVVSAIVMAGLAFAASGCFTAFTPKREFCTGDPKNTDLPLCKPSKAQG